MDEGRGAVARAANALTGIKTVSIDPELEAYYARKDRTMSQLRDLERRGLVGSPEIYALTQAGKESQEAPEIRALLQQAKGKKKVPATFTANQ